MKLIPEKEFNEMSLRDARLHLLEMQKYLERFPVIKYTREDFAICAKRLQRVDFCHTMKRAVYKVFKMLLSRTQPTSEIQHGDVVFLNEENEIGIVGNNHGDGTCNVTVYEGKCGKGYLSQAHMSYPVDKVTLISKGDFK